VNAELWIVQVDGFVVDEHIRNDGLWWRWVSSVCISIHNMPAGINSEKKSVKFGRRCLSNEKSLFRARLCIIHFGWDWSMPKEIHFGFSADFMVKRLTVGRSTRPLLVFMYCEEYRVFLYFSYRPICNSNSFAQ
jgi:hypothetical protein